MKGNNRARIPPFDMPVRIADDGRQVRIGINLRDVTEEQIRIDLEKTTLTLSVSGSRKIKKSIRIPEGARLFKKKFSEGELEIILEKPAP